MELDNLRDSAIKVYLPEGTEVGGRAPLLTEENVQSSKIKGKMQPKSVEKWCLFCAEVLQEIVENTANSANHGLKTVNKAAVEDKATKATPDALD